MYGHFATVENPDLRVHSHQTFERLSYDSEGQLVVLTNAQP